MTVSGSGEVDDGARGLGIVGGSNAAIHGPGQPQLVKSKSWGEGAGEVGGKRETQKGCRRVLSD